MIMKDRVTKRTKMNMEAEERRLAHIKQHVAKLKAEHDSRNDFDFGTKGTNFTSHYFPHLHWMRAVEMQNENFKEVESALPPRVAEILIFTRAALNYMAHR